VFLLEIEVQGTRQLRERKVPGTYVFIVPPSMAELRRRLIVRGQAHLLDDLHALEDLERVRLLFDDLETRREVIDLLGRAESAEGVRIFIGSENKLFSLSGSSTIIAPYHDRAGSIIGVIGVIGPTRLNYARVIPMVDYTAKVVGKLLTG